MATTESIEPGWVKSCCQKNGDQGCFVTVIYCVLYYSVKQENLCRWTKLGNNARWTNRKCENVIKFEALSIFFYTLQSAWRPTLRNGGRSRTVLSCKTQLPRGPGKFWQLSVLLYLSDLATWLFTWSWSLWKGVRFRDLQRSLCSSVCSHPGTSYTGQQNCEFKLRL